MLNPWGVRYPKDGRKLREKGGGTLLPWLRKWPADSAASWRLIRQADAQASRASRPARPPEFSAMDARRSRRRLCGRARASLKRDEDAKPDATARLSACSASDSPSHNRSQRRDTPATMSVIALALSLGDEAEREPAAAGDERPAMAALVPVQTLGAAIGAAIGLAVAQQQQQADEFDTQLRRECQICFEPLDALQAHMCLSCGGSYCSGCARAYIEHKVLDGEVSDKKLVCPSPQCARPLAEDMVEALLAPALFDKYREFLRNQRAGIRFCPRAGCCAIIDEPLFSSRRRVACSACQHESCMRCGGDFHAVPLCRRVEKRFGRWKKRNNVRACPSCKTNIEKNGGCAHMKCFHCDQEFCWSCLRPWDTHDETLCVPLTFIHSKSNKYGCWTPMRVVTKTAVASAAVVVAVAGVGVAVVVLPPLLAVHFAKESYRRGRFAREAYVHVVHTDVPPHVQTRR